jgi:hypothetical protein
MTAARVTPGAISLSSATPFPADAVFECREARRVAARSRQAGNEAGTDRVYHSDKHDRHRARRPLQRGYDAAGRSQDHIRCERDQLSGISAIPFGVAGTPANIDARVTPVGPAQFLQRLHEGNDASLAISIIRGRVHQHADAPHPLGLLPARRKRPSGGSAAEQRDERAAFHSISLVNANQSFCGDVSDGRTRPAQLHASNRQANDDESAHEHTDRGQPVFAETTGFAHSGTEPSRRGSRSLLHLRLHASQLRIPAAMCSSVCFSCCACFASWSDGGRSPSP